MDLLLLALPGLLNVRLIESSSSSARTRLSGLFISTSINRWIAFFFQSTRVDQPLVDNTPSLWSRYKTNKKEIEKQGLSLQLITGPVPIIQPLRGGGFLIEKKKFLHSLDYSNWMIHFDGWENCWASSRAYGWASGCVRRRHMSPPPVDGGQKIGGWNKRQDLLNLPNTQRGARAEIFRSLIHPRTRKWRRGDMSGSSNWLRNNNNNNTNNSNNMGRGLVRAADAWLLFYFLSFSP